MEQSRDDAEAVLYLPLSSDFSTRFFLLEPGEFEDDIIGLLAETLVDDSSPDADYEALLLRLGLFSTGAYNTH
jgi:hypothetical protein